MNCFAPPSEISSLNLLLFSLGGVFFGVDAEQVETIGVHHAEEESGDVLWSHTLLGFGTIPVAYCSPTVLVIKSDRKVPCRIIIDSMEDLYDCPYDSITPFPPLLEHYLVKRGIWGMLQKNDQIVLLVDFKRIIP